MNQIIIGIVVVAVLGGGYLLFSGGQDASMMNKDAMSGEEVMMKDEAAMDDKEAMEGEVMMKNEAMTKDGSMMEKDAMMQKGSYEAYAASKLAMADTGDVVLFFRASWCPNCKVLHENIQANLSAIPAGLTILDVDYDNSAELKQKYGVTIQHTLVQVDANGSLIKKWSGSPTLASLVAQVQ